MFYFLKRADLKGLLEALSLRWDVFIPVGNNYGDVRFEKFRNGRTDNFDVRRIDFSSQTLIPPKEVFFPQSEVMFQYKESEKSCLEIENVSEKDSDKPRLVFGVKPCDYNAITVTNRFFMGSDSKYVDYYYALKASESLIIVAACLTPPEPDACFCVSSGTGPFLDSEKGDSYDIQIIEVAGEHFFTDSSGSGNAGFDSSGFIVETASDRGEDFITENNAFFESLDETEVQKRITELRERAFENVQLKPDFKGAVEAIGSIYGTRGKIDVESAFKRELKDIYEEIANRCIYCGACLYTCPTCSCFNVYDNSNWAVNGSPLVGERVRVWDGCVFSGYTRETSGHNPRDDAYKRAARRYEHKLFYDVELHGRSSCVGCGRCLTACPVDIGMSTFIEELSGKKQVK